MVDPLSDTQNSNPVSDEIETQSDVTEVSVDSIPQTFDETLLDQIKEWENTAKRYAADLKNQANQHTLDILQTRKNTKKVALYPVLEFLNTLNLAFAFTPATEDEKVLKFISTLRNSFEKIKNDLKAQGYEIIEPKIGDNFDPETMNALNQHDSEDHPTVKHIVSLGCKIDGVVVTPAMAMI
jgi:molecular chaperone GrpE (heat shock protein)